MKKKSIFVIGRQFKQVKFKLTLIKLLGKQSKTIRWGGLQLNEFI